MPPELPSDGPLRVLVVDADDRVRESLAGLLAIGGRLVVVGSAGDPGPALALAAAELPDVVVVDPRLPGMSAGVDFMSRLRDLSPAIRILAMGWAEGPDDADVASRADGWVRKTFRPSELVAAVVAASGRNGTS